MPRPSSCLIPLAVGTGTRHMHRQLRHCGSYPGSEEI